MRRGFTLLEMILVMTVIAILFLLTIPNTQSSLNIVNKKGCDAQLKIVDAAIIQYMLANDTQQVSMDELIAQGYLTQRQSQCHDGTPISIDNNQANV